MAFFRDELAREKCTFLSSTSLKLDGVFSEFYVRFADSKRRDGSAVQTGDTCIVGVAQTGVGRAVCRATLTLGATTTLTLDSSLILKSTAGSGLPGFSSAGAQGDVALVSTAEDPAFDDVGNLLNPDRFRLGVVKPEIKGATGFIGEIGTVDKEGVFGLGLDAAGDGLAGPYYRATGTLPAADGEDVLANLDNPAIILVRAGMKLARTYRNDALAAGNFLSLLTASAPARAWLVSVWDSTRAHRAAAIVHGHASDPQVDVIHEFGATPFELQGVNVGIRNNSGGALTIAHVRPVIG